MSVNITNTMTESYESNGLSLNTLSPDFHNIHGSNPLSLYLSHSSLKQAISTYSSQSISEGVTATQSTNDHEPTATSSRDRSDAILYTEELEKELILYKRKNSELQKELEQKEELLDRKSTQIITYASENAKLQNEISKLQIELSAKENNVYIIQNSPSKSKSPNGHHRALSHSVSIQPRRRNKRKRKTKSNKSKSTNSNSNGTPKSRHIIKRKKLNTTRCKSFESSIESIDEQSTLTFSNEYLELYDQNSDNDDYISPPETEMPYLMPSLATNTSTCSNLSLQACKLSLPQTVSGKESKMIIQIDPAHVYGPSAPSLKPSLQRLGIQDSNPPPFIPKPPMIRVLSPIAENNSHDNIELNSFSLDGPGPYTPHSDELSHNSNHSSATNITPIPSTPKTPITPTPSPNGPLLLISNNNDDISSEWSGCMAQIDNDEGQLHIIQDNNYNDFQSDDDSDTSFFTENTEQMLQKNLGLNGGVFSETESDDDHPHNHTVSLCKQTTLSEDCISYMSDNTHIYMDLNHPINGSGIGNDEWYNNTSKNFTKLNYKRWSKSLTQLTQLSSLFEVDSTPQPILDTMELTERSQDTISGCDAIIRAPFTLCIAN